MLRILDAVPKDLLAARTTQLAGILGGPTLLRLPGNDQAPLFISTLLHGNETTGWEALRMLLRQYQRQPLPRPVTIFIGNVLAAQACLRRLDGQPDFNRIWSLGEGSERVMAQTVLREIERLKPAVCLDIHNTSGHNPVYACVHRLDDASLQLAQGFSPTSVLVMQPESLLGVACSAIAPALTLECGKPGNHQVAIQVCDFLRDCLMPKALPEAMTATADSQLLYPVATVRVPDDVSFSFEDQQNGEQVEICFKAGLDGHNFSTLPKGTVMAKIRPGSGATLQVLDVQGKDISGRYFRIENDTLLTTSDLVPSLLTVNTRIIRQDCLCYLMEPVVY